MMASSPVLARETPPDTGASIITPPAAATRAASARVSPGAPDVMSTTTVPGFIAGSSPSSATPTAALVGSMDTIRSDPAASCAGVSGTLPPTCCAKLSAAMRRWSASSSV